MSRRTKWILGVLGVLFAIVLAIIIPLSIGGKTEKRALALDPTSTVPTATAIVLPTATAIAQPTETPAFPTPTATALPALMPSPIPTETPEPTVVGTPTPTLTPTPVVWGVLFPLFTLQTGESTTLTIPPEPAGTAVFDFETNGPPIELQIEYKGELVFLRRCKDAKDPTKPFNSFMYVPLKVSLEEPQARFIFTNSCEVSSVQVSAGYTITLQP